MVIFASGVSSNTFVTKHCWMCLVMDFCNISRNRSRSKASNGLASILLGKRFIMFVCSRGCFSILSAIFCGFSSVLKYSLCAGVFSEK